MARSCAQRRLETGSPSLLGDPRYMHGVAYGFRSDADILPLDV